MPSPDPLESSSPCSVPPISKILTPLLDHHYVHN